MKVTYVVEALPAVTDARMDLYKQVSKNRDIPIVQAPVSETATLGATYFNAVHPGTIMWPLKPAQMVVHGSLAHRALEVLARNGGANKIGKYADHKGCAICARSWRCDDWLSSFPFRSKRNCNPPLPGGGGTRSVTEGEDA